MAKQRRLKYRVTSGDGSAVHDVAKSEFERVLDEGLATLAKYDRRTAIVKARYRMHVDRQTGRLSFELVEKPERDPAGIKSWWGKLVGRHELYFGAANEVLYLWAAQAEGIVARG